MGRNRRKRKGSFLKRNRIALLFLGGLLVYLSITIVNQEIKLRDIQKEERQKQKVAEQLRKELSETQKKVKKSTDQEFVEKTAREKLKMVKQNEIIYIIKDEKQTD